MLLFQPQYSHICECNMNESSVDSALKIQRDTLPTSLSLSPLPLSDGLKSLLIHWASLASSTPCPTPQCMKKYALARLLWPPLDWVCVYVCVRRRTGSCNIQKTLELLGATSLACAGIEVSAPISAGDCQRKDYHHNHFTASFLLVLPRHLLIPLQALSIILSYRLSSPSSTLSSLLYLYPAANWLSPICQPRSLSSIFSLLLCCIPISLLPPHCATFLGLASACLLSY